MHERTSDRSTLSHLRDVKDSLGLSAPDSHQIIPSNGIEEGSLSPRCINCGYEQQGQRVDRCPECGLLWASRICDPTLWSMEGASPQTWALTASQIVLWDERLRIRTSLVPVTRASKRFAVYCILLTTVPLSIMLTPDVSTGLTPPVRAIGFMVNLLFTAAAVAATLFGGQFALHRSLKGVWRRRLDFIPASVDYATAWWPPLAWSLLLLRWYVTSNGLVELSPLLPWSAVSGLVLWGLWMWASVSESGHIRHTGLRILCSSLLVALTSVWLIGITTDALRFTVTGALVKSNTSLANIRTFMVGGPPAAAPRTYALIIDVIPGIDDLAVLQGMAELGATGQYLIALRNQNATLRNIQNAIATARIAVRAQDRFILYINGHGSPYGAGSIRVADGEITTQNLRTYLFGMSTPNSLVIIDSCFGGKFIDQLRGVANAVVLASTDDRDVAFETGLRPFWHALTDPRADTDHDGDVTVKEAFWSAYRPMLRQAEMMRRWDLQQNPDPAHTRLLQNAGYATPQLESLGTATEDAFAVTIKPATGQPR